MAHNPNGWRSTKDAFHFDGVAVVRTLARHDDVAPRCKPFVSALRTMGVGLSLSDHNLTIRCFCSVVPSGAVGTACLHVSRRTRVFRGCIALV